MRKKHFSRLWKKLTRHLPEIRRVTVGSERSAGEGTRESARKAKYANRAKGDKNRKPISRQTKTMRTQGRV